jgi:predicted transcriptional regulator
LKKTLAALPDGHSNNSMQMLPAGLTPATQKGIGMTQAEKTGNLTDISGLRLAELMSPQVLTVYEGWSIKRLAGFFVKHNISGAPVVASDDSLVGVVSEADVIRFESKSPSDAEIRKMAHFYHGPNAPGLTQADIQRLKQRAIETCTVNSIMTSQVHSLDMETSAAAACRFMVEQDIRRLFATSEGRVVGVVTAMDFLRRMAL